MRYFKARYGRAIQLTVRLEHKSDKRDGGLDGTDDVFIGIEQRALERRMPTAMTMYHADIALGSHQDRGTNIICPANRQHATR